MADDPEGVIASSVGNLYFNGFQLGLSNADVSTLLLLDGQPRLTLNMSYTTAKTLHTALSEMISTLEKVTDRKIMTISEVSQGLETLSSDEKDDIIH